MTLSNVKGDLKIWNTRKNRRYLAEDLSKLIRFLKSEKVIYGQGLVYVNSLINDIRELTNDKRGDKSNSFSDNANISQFYNFELLRDE